MADPADHSHTPFSIPLGMIPLSDNSYTFSVHSTLPSLELRLYHPGKSKPYSSTPLQSEGNNLLSTTLSISDPDIEYMLYSPDVGEILDPYARALSTPSSWDHWKVLPRCQLITGHKFDWEGVKAPSLPKESLVIYEMHARGFTQSPTSKVDAPGTYLGIVEKIPYLKSLGINCIELMPIFEFDERENPHESPNINLRLYNYWGYSTLNFFSPMKRYASNSNRLSPLSEFKTLVRELHRNGIEVVLDVVYNHTSTKACLDILDKQGYYILGPSGEHTNFSGCGNTINANSPPSIQLILSSLRYWAEECHVDGFRFDLAGCLTRNQDGPMENPTLFEQIANDPILSKKKLMGEPWDCGGINLNGRFPCKEFSEWNGNFKTTLRQFLRGDPDLTPSALNALCGQIPDQSATSPYVNYIACHDGFSLKDLVSYEQKHNLSNGEDNRDGDDENFSTNCGAEGPSDDPEIQEKRELLMKKHLMAALFAKGIPLITMGDECGLTHFGNNNPYCHDSELSWMNWELIEQNAEFASFVTRAIRLKHSDHLLKDPSQLYSPLQQESDERSGVFIGDSYFLGFNRGAEEWDLSETFDAKWKVVLAPLEEQYDTPRYLLPYSAFVICKREELS